jgi:small GTP-binding protein
MMRLCNKDFSEDRAPSIGSTFTRIGPEEFQIWDTAGQEKYRSLGPIAVRGTEIAILVFDITVKSSFHSLGDSLVNSAGDSLRDIVVAGNKSDLRPAERIGRDAAEATAE